MQEPNAGSKCKSPFRDRSAGASHPECALPFRSATAQPAAESLAAPLEARRSRWSQHLQRELRDLDVLHGDTRRIEDGELRRLWRHGIAVAEKLAHLHHLEGRGDRCATAALPLRYRCATSPLPHRYPTATSPLPRRYLTTTSPLPHHCPSPLLSSLTATVPHRCGIEQANRHRMLDLSADDTLRARVHHHEIGRAANLRIQFLLARRVGADSEDEHGAPRQPRGFHQPGDATHMKSRHAGVGSGRV